MSNIVAIVGRPNVGKSTLFNRLTESKQAIVDEISGVTRDRHYGKVSWGGREFDLIDTGGYVKGSDDEFEEEICKQVEAAIDEANLLLFVVDTKTGVTDLDQTVTSIIRKSGKDVIIVANKVDNFDMIADTSVFYKFGLGDVFPISSINGSGTGDLLDKIIGLLPEDKKVEVEKDIPNIAVIGKPNVGKSSLINCLLGKDQNIVTPIAGTTRDSVTTRFNSFGFDINLIDTAGLRKKGKVHEDLEFYSVMRTVRALEYADVCLIMIDAQEGITSQDLNLIGLVTKNKKGMVMVVNKWDLIEKDHKTTKEYEELIRSKTAPFVDYPIIFTSVPTKQRIFKALEEAVKIYKNRTQKIPTRKLNDVMLPIIQNTPPPATKGKYVKIKFINQLPTHTPTFAFYCNLPQYVKEPYMRFLENQLRKNFDLHGVPIRIFIRNK